MGCTHEWGQLLSRYVDDEAPPEERLRVEEHLAGCAGCRDLLSLFRRNESLLDNALSGEVFGSQLVEDVMAQIRRRELPPVIAPEVKATPLSRAWGWIAARGAPLAAAAALLAAAAALIARNAESGRLADTLLSLKAGNDALVREVDHVRELSVATMSEFIGRLDEQDREIRTLRAALQAPPDQAYGVVLPRRGIEVAIRVRDMSIFSSFDLERSESRKGNWQAVASDLAAPYHLDTQATPDVAYDYRFIGRRKDGTLDEPMPPVVGLRLPAGDLADPATHIDVQFVAVTPARDQATFRLVRRIDGIDRDCLFAVRPGSMVGGRIRLENREVDFSTGLMLDRLVDSDEVLWFNFGDHRQSMSRANVRADLKRPDSRSGTVRVWRGSSSWIPAPR